MNKVKKNNLIIILLLSFTYIFIANMFNAFRKPNIYFYQPARKYIILFMVVIMFGVLIYNIIKKNKHNTLIWNMAAFIFWVVLSVVINYGLDVTYISSVVWWFAVFYLAYSFGIENNKKIFDYLIIFGMGMICYLYASNALPHWGFGDEGTNSLYYGVCFIPIVFLLKNKWIKLLLLLAISVITFYSGKSTALLMILFGVFAYLLSNKENKKNKTLLNILIFFSVLLITILVAFCNDYLVDLGVDLTGNGRAQIWQLVIEKFNNFGIRDFFFGKSVNGVTNSIGISAHNDFLEVLFDYGFIGFLLYVFMFINLFLQAKELKKRKAKYYEVFLMSIIMTLIISLFSNIIFIPRYFIAITFVWGYILGIDKQELFEKKEEVFYNENSNADN